MNSPKWGMLSQRAIAALEHSGWTESTIYDIENDLVELRNRNFEINDAALAVLRKFGGTSIRIDQGAIRGIVFDVREAFHTLVASDLVRLSDLINEVACPVGAGAGHVLLVCPSGKTALLHEQWFSLLTCATMAEMFELVLFNDRAICTDFGDIEMLRPE